MLHAGLVCWERQVESRQIEVRHADLTSHQLVEKRLEEVFENDAPPLVDVDLVVDRFEDRDDLALFL